MKIVDVKAYWEPDMEPALDTLENESLTEMTARRLRTMILTGIILRFNKTEQCYPQSFAKQINC